MYVYVSVISDIVIHVYPNCVYEFVCVCMCLCVCVCMYVEGVRG